MKKRWICLLLAGMLTLSACGGENPASAGQASGGLEEDPAAEIFVSEESPEPVSQVCGLYLQVLADLWEVDSGLNGGIRYLGLDLSGVTDLTEADREHIVREFGGAHELEVIIGDYEDLREQGYLMPFTEGTELCWWENGVLFSITGSAEDFDAHKWRSPLGAYFFADCSAEQASDGGWNYKIGSEAIA